MRTTLVIGLASTVVLAACAGDESRLDVRVRWDGEAPTFDRSPHAFFLLTSPEGEAVRLAGPIELAPAARMELLSIPVERPFTLLASVHEAPFRNAPVLGAGRSEVFELAPSGSKTIEIILAPGPGELEPPGAPPAPLTEKITFRSSPWGSEASNGRPVLEVVGDPGALPAGARFVVLDREPIREAAELARGVTDEQGAFAVELLGRPGPAVTHVHIAHLGNDATISDSSTVAGLQAALVHRTIRTLAFGGKLAGRDFPNPHRAFQLVRATPALQPPEGTEDEVERYESLLEADQEVVSVDAIRSWTRVEASVGPEVRAGASMAFDAQRGRIVLTGGCCRGALPFADVWEWDGLRWIERPVSGERPGPRWSASSAYDAARGEVILFGGLASPTDDARDDLWAWDGMRWARRDPASGVRPTARFGAAMAYDDKRARVLLFGGADRNFPTDTWAWDGLRWTQLTYDGPTPPARTHAAATYDANRDRFVIVGGVGREGALADQWEWDGERWHEVPSDPLPALWGAALTFDRHRNRLVMFGGNVGIFPDERLVTADLWEHDGEAWRRIPAEGGAPSARTRAAMTHDPIRRHVILFGGWDPDGAGPEMWSWDGAQWRQLGGGDFGPGLLEEGRLAFDARRQRMVHFGGTYGGRPIDATYEWSGGWIRRSLPRSPTPRRDHALAYHAPTQRVVLFGGVSGLAYLEDTWTFDGAEWTPQPMPRAPQGRVAAAVAVEPSGHVILFGGQRGREPLGDTWRYDGTTWIPTATIGPSPPARAGAAMALDEARGTIVLTGGHDGTTFFEDTWEWNGRSWRQAGGFHPHRGRWGHSLVYDPERRRVVMLNGCTSLLLSAQDGVWEWDAERAVWSTLPLSGPSPGIRCFSAAAFEPSEGVIMLVGGATGAHRGTWGLGGRSWRLLDGPEAVPPARRSASLAYARDRAELVLTGGCKTPSCWSVAGDNWSFNGYAWRRRPISGAPPQRGAHVAVEAPSPGGVMVIGGIDDAHALTSGISTLYDGTWQPSNLTYAVIAPGAAYDPTGDRVLIFGGAGFRFDTSSALVVLGGQQLDNLGQQPVPPRWKHAVTFDEGRGKLVSVGGCDQAVCEDGILDRHDEWDEASGWQQAGTVDSPAIRRYGASATYDAARGRVLLFGGRSDVGWPEGVMEWDGATWHTVQVRGPAPAARIHAALAFHRDSNAAVLFGGFREDETVLFEDTWRLHSDPELHPAVQVSFAVGTDARELSSVRAIRVGTVVGGRGFATTIPGAGAEHTGARLELWDAWSGAWRELGVTAAGVNTPARLEATVESEIARRAIGADGRVHLRASPGLGAGTGNHPPSVHVDFWEVEVELDHRRSTRGQGG